jgi:hypothetical protein
MNVITVKRTATGRKPQNAPTRRRSFRELGRGYFAREKGLEFAIELLFFAIIIATAAWPILVAATALNEFLQRGAS